MHSHTLVLDGIYDARDGMRFRPLSLPDEDEVERVTRSIARGIARLPERRGLAPDADPEEIDPPARDEPLLAALYSASVRGRIATGPRAGQAVLRRWRPNGCLGWPAGVCSTNSNTAESAKATVYRHDDTRDKGRRRRE